MGKFSHVPFEPVRTGFAKIPKRDDGTSPQTKLNKQNRAAHKQALQSSIDLIRRQYESEFALRESLGLPKIPVGISLLIKVDPEDFDVDSLKSRYWGLEVVCETDEGYVLVVSPDTDLGKFREQLDGFVEKKHGTATVASVHEIVFEEGKSSRLQRILHPNLLERWNEVVALPEVTIEISIECNGTKKLPNRREHKENETESGFRARQETFNRELEEYFEEYDRLREERENSLRLIMEGYGGNIVEIFEEGTVEGVDFPDSFTIVAVISGAGLRDIAFNFPFVFEIAAREIGSIENSGNPDVVDNIVYEVNPPTNSASFVVIIDSGIQEAHPLISPSIQSSLSRNFLDPTRTVQDDYPNYGGHGTRVAGAALFPKGIPDGLIQLPFFIVNAKILDGTGHIPENILPARLLERIVEYYTEVDSTIKIYNHSINSPTSARLGYMSSWAAKIDDLAYERDVLFVQSVGNISISNHHPTRLGMKQHLTAGRSYPDYLREASCKVANPSQSLNALTVGSLSGISFESQDYHAIGDPEGPSPFSRTGPSIWNVVKPDVVEIGGNLTRSRESNPLIINNPEELSLQLPRRSDTGQLVDRSEIGTSFSAPMVAHLAAILQMALPDESSLLYRGLIAQSARWPNWRLTQEEYYNNFAHFGFGRPDLERASRNSENRITFYSRGRQQILAKEIHFFEIPIPEEIRRIGSEDDVLIEVTLSYVAKPKRTRRNPRKYLSTWVDWVSSKLGESMDSFVNWAEKDGDPTQVHRAGEIQWVLGDRDDRGQVNDLKRNVGTLQKDWTIIKSHQLGDSFSIAVRGHKGWDTADIYPAYYSLIVSLETENPEIELYNSIKAEVEVRSRIEIPIQVL